MTTAPISLQDEFIKTAFMDTSSPHDGAVFFSGPKAKRKAKKLSSTSEDYQTVIDTPALKEFNKYQKHYFGPDADISLQDAYFIGDCISEYFAKNATGTVRIFLDGVKPHGTFNRAEMPELTTNDKIDKFLVYDAAPFDKNTEPFSEMEMTHEELKEYVAHKVEKIPPRAIGQSLKCTEGTAPA